MLCVACVASIFGDVYAFAARSVRRRAAAKADYRTVESVAVLLSCAAFAFTPGLLAAATRISPLMVELLPVLVAIALLVDVATDVVDEQVRRFGHGGFSILAALLLLGYSAMELLPAWRLFSSLAFPALGVYFVVGALPALAIAWFVHLGIVSDLRTRLVMFGGWGLAILVMVGLTFTSGTLERGKAATRLVTWLIAGSERCKAVVGDGALDDLLVFMLPEDRRAILLSRDDDPAYGRELAKWIETLPCGTNKTELLFAAELGPRTLLEEWAKLDRKGFEATVRTVENYFPTQAQWDEACAELDRVRPDDPYAPNLRHLLGRCGNALGCRLIEAGDLQGAWSVFWKTLESVDRDNHSALLNLAGMADRGYAAPKSGLDWVRRRQEELGGVSKDADWVARAIRKDGEVYAVHAETATPKGEKAGLELSPEMRRLLETVTVKPDDLDHCAEMRSLVHRAIFEKKLRVDQASEKLIGLDLALGDRVEAEKNAIKVLRLNRQDFTANATLGMLNGSRGDYAAAERYLRRVVATDKSSPSMKNDYAQALYRLGRLQEAERYAREAVKEQDDSWQFHETLTAILIGLDQIAEAEAELDKTDALARKEGIYRGRVVGIEIDRARLYKAKRQVDLLMALLRKLKNRTDVTPAQREEIEGITQ